MSDSSAESASINEVEVPAAGIWGAQVVGMQINRKKIVEYVGQMTSCATGMVAASRKFEW
jgi:hypothetical protein